MNDHYQDLIEELGASVVKTHTPEPWTIKGPVTVDGAEDYAIMAKGQIICETFGRTSNSNYEPSFANACLIVAAPLMLKELENCAQDFSNFAAEFPVSSDMWVIATNCAFRVKKLVAKARGES